MVVVNRHIASILAERASIASLAVTHHMIVVNRHIASILAERASIASLVVDHHVANSSKSSCD